LAFTGADHTDLYLGIAVAMVLGGFVLTVAARRRARFHA
jgi:hypothetical protein